VDSYAIVEAFLAGRGNVIDSAKVKGFGTKARSWSQISRELQARRGDVPACAAPW
jgi:hypothetical protein